MCYSSGLARRISCCHINICYSLGIINILNIAIRDISFSLITVEEVSSQPLYPSFSTGNSQVLKLLIYETSCISNSPSALSLRSLVQPVLPLICIQPELPNTRGSFSGDNSDLKHSRGMPLLLGQKQSIYSAL